MQSSRRGKWCARLQSQKLNHHLFKLIGILYAGTSLVLNLEENSGQPEILGVLKRKDEAVGIWEI